MLALAAIVAAYGCASKDTRAPPPVECATCIDALRTNGWCEPCGRGYVAGRAIPSRMLHEALDAHGHELGPGGVLCLECAEALEVDGFCPRCRSGFVGGQLYFGELSWSLHRGTMRPREEVRCPGCREVYGGIGDCPRCGALWVGSVEFRDPALHARAAHQFRRLELALERLPDCEMCATAGFFGRDCPRCGRGPVPE